ncbi:MAG: selenide, water dikinase SelD, partial [Gemmatimonadetes bacterium]|nr:selenide, water dikinase SelD [Gemmatimonadota bacterium]
MRSLLPVEDPNALVDSRTRDDAAVYLIDKGRALVVTLDFFTPIVDDAADFGRIAAANALSDVYAMGARPMFALNLLSFPRGLLEEGIVEEIVRGGAEKAAEAGIPVLGGHTIDDPEPKYGMVVVGEVDPAHMFANDRAQAGDVLVLTKPLGTGVVATAIKADACPPELLERATQVMTTLNRGAAAAALSAGAHTATDVTGYGLTGHLRNMVVGSGLSARIEASRV